MKTVDEIFYRCGFPRHTREDRNMFDNKEIIIVDNYNDAKSQLLEAVLEVIGEDELEEVEYDETIGKQTDLTLVIRNQLKAEQRKRAKELFGVEE